MIQLVDTLEKATSNAERAALLLRVPDALLVTYGNQLAFRCTRASFAAGAAFIAARIAALTAERDAHGLLPWRVAMEAESWRGAISEVAAGKNSGSGEPGADGS